MRLYILLCFISLCGLAISCNPEWFPYNQKCYRAIKFPYDVRLARRYCQIFRGDLATINDNSTLQSFSNNLINATNELYWVNENSTIGENSTGTSCSYVYYDFDGKMVLDSHSECGEGKHFICEVAEEDKGIECPKSWSLYGDTCYKTFKTRGTYVDAVHFCSFQRAQLAILDNIAKEHNAAAVIIGKKEPFLVAVLEDSKQNSTGDTIAHWTNGQIFQPSCAECRNRTLGGCIGFSSDPQHPTMFTWVNLNCDSFNSFLCEMSPSVSSQNATQPSTVPTTTMAPLRCPVGYNWKVHEESGYCFWETTYETERLNWYQARQFCQLYGGDLATYDSQEQEEHGLGGAKGHYRGLWFGLKRGDYNDDIHWINGKDLDYTNWNTDEPNLKSQSKFCVMHGSYYSKWELDYCGVRRWFICKAPKMSDPKMPDTDFFKKTQCNFTGPSIYRTQWYLYDNHCYLVKDAAKYSWDTAQYFCEDNGGHLASVHSFQETNFILQVIPSSSSIDYWIGLSARGLNSPYSWSDGSSSDFFYWADNYNETTYIDKCVTFDKQRGFWNTEHCNRFLGVICKRGVNASYDFTTPEPTALMPGNCESGWYRFGNKCFKTFGEMWSERKSWPSALANCKELDATLLSIHSSEEQDFVMDLLLDLKTSAWIGLESEDKRHIFKWSDDSALDYTNWNVGEPGGDDSDYRGIAANKLCLELDYNANEIGKWNDVDCSKVKGYICQKRINHTLTEPSEDPFKCSNFSDWHRLGSSCYGIFEEDDDHLSWVAAQAKCRTFNSNLVTFRTFAVAIYLKKRIKKEDQFFWIGTRETRPNKYESIGTGPFLINWLAGQPQRTSDMNNCVSIDSSGKWIVKNCKEKHPFICELKPKEEETTDTIEEDKPCPTAIGWVDLNGDQCYLFGHRRVNWNTALYECYKNGGHLASFHSLNEMLIVKNYLSSNSDESSYHIGLGKKSDNSYGWVDFSPVDFTYWEDIPSPTTSMKCVQLHPKSALWRPVDCEDMLRNYICSYPKRISRKGIFDYSSTAETSKIIQDGELQSGLGAGGITGIILSVFIIAFVIGGLIYHFYPRSTIKPSFLDSESL